MNQEQNGRYKKCRGGGKKRERKNRDKGSLTDPHPHQTNQHEGGSKREGHKGDRLLINKKGHGILGQEEKKKGRNGKKRKEREKEEKCEEPS